MSCSSGSCTCGKNEHAHMDKQVFLTQRDLGGSFIAADDWTLGLKNLSIDPEIVEIRFKNNVKQYFLNSKMLQLSKDDWVIVESEDGYDIGAVSNTGGLAKKLFDKTGARFDTKSLQHVSRIASNSDVSIWLEARKSDRKYLQKSREILSSLNIDFHISDAVIRADLKLLTLFCTLNNKVDLEEIKNRFSSEFSMRIHFQQNGSPVQYS